jgi:hypothetical protein
MSAGPDATRAQGTCWKRTVVKTKAETGYAAIPPTAHPARRT